MLYIDKNCCFYKDFVKYNLLFNNKSKELFKSKIKDENASNKDMKYKSYDNSFKEFKIDLKDITFSASSLANYASCPFKYYLEKVIKVKEPETDDYYSRLGSFAHSLYEKIIGSNILVTNELILENLKESGDFSDKEKILIKETLLDTLRCSIEKFKEIIDSLIGASVDREEKVEFKDENNNSFSGKIDLIIHDKENKSAIIVDYKSGKVDKKIDNTKYGLEFQLPIYYESMKDKYKDIEGVFYYTFVKSKKDKSNVKNNIISNESNFKDLFKLEGIKKNYDEDDSYLLNEISNYIKDIKESLEFKDFIDNSKEKRDEAIKDIYKGKFTIEPKVINEVDEDDPYGEKPACKYCQFNSICYKKEFNIKVLKGED